MKPKFLVGTAAALATLVLAAPAVSDGPTTVDRTIQAGPDGNRLVFGPGEGYVVRPSRAKPRKGREKRRERLLHFAQLSDFQYTDEESPMRLEYLDDLSDMVGGAYRSQETVGSQVIESMVRRLRNIRSPVDGATPDNFVVTGDSADSNQLNETRGFIDTLDGSRVNPDSGRHGTCSILGGWSEWRWWPPGWVWTSRYAGVRGGNMFYEPDSSGLGIDGPGYSPDEAENIQRANRSVAMRDFPGLLEAAQSSFRATGLGAPWYSAQGNHDGLVQGNIPGRLLGDLLNDIATGCLKLFAPGTMRSGGLRSAYIDYLEHPGPSEAERLKSELLDTFGRGQPRDMNAARSGMGVRLVPDDPGRRLLTTEEWVQEHFNTSGTPRGHGFDSRPDVGLAYYSTSPKPGIRYIVLDSVNEQGLASGRVDDRQFRWLEGELRAAANRDELVIAFAHHTLGSMNNGFDLRLPPRPAYHFGLRGENGLPPHGRGESIEELFLRYPNVIALVAGHTHNNKITRFGSSDGAFWEINTVAPIDWSGQSRLVELFNNHDGTLSIFTTIVDHAAVPDAGDSPNLSDPLSLASIGREFTYNDKDGSTGEDGRHNARGDRIDRNVELILPDPR